MPRPITKPQSLFALPVGSVALDVYGRATQVCKDSEASTCLKVVGVDSAYYPEDGDLLRFPFTVVHRAPKETS